MRHPIAAALLAAAAAAGAGCSSSGGQEAQQACPNAYRVQEAATLVRFKPGPGRDPTDVEFRTDIGNIEIACSFSSRRQTASVEIKVQFLVAQGPGLVSNRAAFEYAVGVIGPGGTHLQRQRFPADVSFTPQRTRGTVTDEVVISLPNTPELSAAAYRIAVALILTPEELGYNQRAAGGAAPAR
jgi:hypothetical protein